MATHDATKKQAAKYNDTVTDLLLSVNGSFSGLDSL